MKEGKKMNNNIYKIKIDLEQNLKEINKNAKMVYKYLNKSKSNNNKETITNALLDIIESSNVIESLLYILEKEYENE